MACRDPSERLDAGQITPEHKGKIVIGGGRMTGDAIHQAVKVGAAALVSGGIDDQDLKNILGYDLGVAVTGSERIGLTLIVTEGFGEIAMAERTFRLLASRSGAPAAVNGATQIRAGVLRPEIAIPIQHAGAAAARDEAHNRLNSRGGRECADHSRSPFRRDRQSVGSAARIANARIGFQSAACWKLLSMELREYSYREPTLS